MSRSITLELPDLRLWRKVSRLRIITFILAIFLILAIIFWKDIYVFAVYRNAGEREVQRLLLDLSPHVALPTNETPALATITNKAALSQGGVLKDAQNGDQLVLYYKSSKAYVYRPSTHKIIAIGPLVIDPSAQQVKGTKIQIKNGSGDRAKYQQIVARMKERYPSATISDEGNAARSDYPQTIVIDLTTDGKKAEFSRAIGDLIDAQTGILPIGEEKPNADMLIIVGKD